MAIQSQTFAQTGELDLLYYGAGCYGGGISWLVRLVAILGWC